jgi:penicillin amidase
MTNDRFAGRMTKDGIALKWIAHQPGGWLRSIFALDRARDWDSFKDALRGWHTPAVNMVYADVDGRIAYHAVGRIPIRKQGHGLLPVAGWNDDHEWIGDIPFDDLPEQTNHPTNQLSNYPTIRLSDETIVTANNRIAGPGYPHFISHEWLNGHRAARIRQRLDACDRVSIEDSLSIQTDVRSLDTTEIVEAVLGLGPHSDREAAALDYLRGWDGVLSADSVAASIYEVTQIELVRLLFADRLGPAFDGYIGMGQTELFVNVNFSNIALRQVRTILKEKPGFSKETRFLRAAFNAALDKLTARLGPDMKKWQWGKLHQLEPAHTLSPIKPLRRFFNRGSYPLGGDGDTPQQANFRPVWPIEPISVAPSHRVVYEVGEWDNSVAVLPGGQSGHPASPHYFDQFPLWLKGEARPMLWGREVVEREAEARLWLTPTD